MAARGRPRRGARAPFRDGLALRRFRLNRLTKPQPEDGQGEAERAGLGEVPPPPASPTPGASPRLPKGQVSKAESTRVPLRFRLVFVSFCLRRPGPLPPPRRCAERRPGAPRSGGGSALAPSARGALRAVPAEGDRSLIPRPASRAAGCAHGTSAGVPGAF